MRSGPSRMAAGGKPRCASPAWGLAPTHLPSDIVDRTLSPQPPPAALFTIRSHAENLRHDVRPLDCRRTLNLWRVQSSGAVTNVTTRRFDEINKAVRTTTLPP
jgi:hypothetical protein